jgi:hypothetical protein
MKGSPMQTRLVDPAFSDRWNAFVERIPHSIAWQRWEWSDLVRAHFGCEFIPLACFEGESLRGVLPLYRLRGRGGKTRLMSVPYAVAGGILADGDEAATALLAEAIRLSREEGGAGITLKQYKVRVPGDLKTDEGYYNRELSLTAGPEALWRELDAVNRERIGRTEGAGLVLEHPSSDLDAFYRILSRHQHRSGIPCVSREWIADLVRLGMYQPALLRKDGRAVAGTLVKSFKRTVSFPFTCVLEPGPGGELAAYRLYWELIRSFSRAGWEICHSGRLPLQGDAEPYRLGWGGTAHPYFYQYHPNTVSQTESAKRGGKRRYFQMAWRLLPRPLATLLGPRIARMFP